MKKLYSLLSSIALLTSLPAIAGPLAEKSLESKANGKGHQPKSGNDNVHAEKGTPKEASSPICRGGGG